MTLRKRVDRIEAGRRGSGLPDRMLLFTAFVPIPPEGEAPGPGEVKHAMVIPKLDGPAVSLWREDGEPEAAFRARADAVTEAAP